VLERPTGIASCIRRRLFCDRRHGATPTLETDDASEEALDETEEELAASWLDASEEDGDEELAASAALTEDAASLDTEELL